MSKNGKQRKSPSEKKPRILEEARQPNTTVAEVLRRHYVDPAMFYRGEKQAREEMKRAWEGRTGDTKASERQVDRLRGKVEKKSRIIAEVIEEAQAIIIYVLKHPREGHRRLTWMMVDEDAAQVSPSSVYRILRNAGQLYLTYHPESNGKLERFHRSTREELGEVDLGNLSRARKTIGRWIEYYNGQRLHASLNYLPPAEYWAGKPRKRMEERKRGLEEPRKKSEAINRKPLQAAA